MAASDSVTGYNVAIKRISHLFADLIDAKRILREVKLLRHFGLHDNVVGLLDLMTSPPDCEDFDTLYIVTHLFECDLERIISSNQRLSDQHAQYFVYQVLRGLKFIHSANVLHRDLKPSNLLVNSNCDLVSFSGPGSDACGLPDRAQPPPALQWIPSRHQPNPLPSPPRPPPLPLLLSRRVRRPSATSASRAACRRTRRAC